MTADTGVPNRLGVLLCDALDVGKQSIPVSLMGNASGAWSPQFGPTRWPGHTFVISPETQGMPYVATGYGAPFRLFRNASARSRDSRIVTSISR